MKTAPASSNKDKNTVLTFLLQDVFSNQLILGDIHAPMNQVSDVYKIIDGNSIIGGWTVFHGFKIPIIGIPPRIPDAWGAINQMVNLLQYPKIRIPFPKKIDDKKLDKYPWNIWVGYTPKLLYEEYALRLTNKDLKVMDISNLPKIRAANENDSELLEEFYNKNSSDFEGFFHKYQLQTDSYVIAEENNEIIAAGGAHFETPYTVQIGNVYVARKYRNKGLGKAIVTAISLGIIKTQRVPTVFINKQNQIAINLFKSIGFEKYNSFYCYELTLE